MSILVFYQRYDGYNGTVYYRDLDDGTIAVAGLQDKTAEVVNIPKYIDGKEVSEIDLYAFNTDDIVKVSLPSGVKKIDLAAFRKCDSLETINIPDTVTEIGRSAFRGCLNLGSVSIPEGVELIENNTFRKAGIDKLSLSENGSLTIGKNAFRDCQNLTTVENMYTVNSVGNNAFMNCVSLVEFELSEKLESIGKKAFYGCSGMTSVVVPSSITTIGSKAFFYCDSLNDITVPYTGTSAEKSKTQSITKIVKFTYPSEKNVNVSLNSSAPLGKKAFKNTPWIYSISLDDSITEIHKKAFNGASNLKSLKMSGSITTIYEAMFADNSTLQTLTGMDKIITIEKDAFLRCPSLISLDLEAVETIGATAFAGCGSLAKLGTLSSLKSIGEYAFDGCSSLNGTFYVGPFLQQIGSHAFTGSCFSSVECEEGLTSIADNAFSGCNQLLYFGFPTSLKTIGANAFESCSKLDNVDLSNTSVSTIGNNAFANCTALTRVALCPDMETIPEYMFYGCSKFDGLYGISNINSLTLTSIGNSAFEGCDMYGYALKIPSSIKSIGSRAFANTRIESIELHDGISSIGIEAFAGGIIESARVPFLGQTAFGTEYGYSWLFGTSIVKSITVTNVNSISNKTFAGGENLVQTVTLENGVQRIEASAFKNFSQLTTVILPDSVNYIGESAFENCAKLQNISIPSGVRTIEKATFSNCRSLNLSISSLAVTSIGDYAFAGTSVVSSGLLTFHKDLISVGASAFAGCGVREVVLTDSMTGINRNAFGIDPNVDILVSSKQLYDHYTELFEDCKNVTVNYN